ncbi:hypothetical protein Agub_g7170 [Astrephomene gubernaculifera]|uniref:Methyltransferase FkbM domain-containing protein n=1 Tax=Astrephomene gubernaculifera TaxID=47775 RepID=A0AAD3HMH6_9CHLO|nr:hypothetical protein Agub_g7170 [Astrephomene gubernaculifera]
MVRLKLRSTAVAALVGWLCMALAGHQAVLAKEAAAATSTHRQSLRSFFDSTKAAAAARASSIATAGTTGEKSGTAEGSRGGMLLGPSPPLREVCHNTCNRARNGVCEEGRPGPGGPLSATYLMAYCDLGTDCEDCGPWRTSAAHIPWENASVPGPVRFLQSRSVQVRVRPAVVPPDVSFSLAYSDPKADFDVSYHLDGSGVVEAGISAIVYKLLSNRCMPPAEEEGGSSTGSPSSRRRGLVVDVGANFGWFAVLAARLGCRVIAYEPVPLFRAFLELSVHLNHLTHLVDIRPYVVSHLSGRRLRMVVPARGIWGTAGIEGLNIDKAIEASQESISVPSVRLEEQVAEGVLLLKVDVEGWEWAVLRGAAGLLQRHTVENIIMEYSPGVPERHFRFDDMAATPAMLVDLLAKYGYRIGHIGDAGKHDSGGGGGWGAELPALREVTLANLKYDVEDVKRWKAGTLGCPTPPELLQYPMWVRCGGVPEMINPRSLRSEIGHNTNLWASKGKGLSDGFLRLEGVVGIFHPDDPADKYFQNNTMAFGMGSRPCALLEPKVQVRHRCRCSLPARCGEEEALVLKLAAEGRMPQNYVLP